MRYRISVHQFSDYEQDYEWHTLTETDDAEMAISEYIKFQESYQRPIKIEDRDFQKLQAQKPSNLSKVEVNPTKEPENETVTQTPEAGTTAGLVP